MFKPRHLGRMYQSIRDGFILAFLGFGLQTVLALRNCTFQSVLSGPYLANQITQLADVNGDGHPDVMVCDRQACDCKFFLSTNETFTPSSINVATQPSFWMYEWALADFDQDGQLDLLVSTTYQACLQLGDSEVRLYWNTANASQPFDSALYFR